jgi:transcription elongation factor Elf1
MQPKIGRCLSCGKRTKRRDEECRRRGFNDVFECPKCHIEEISIISRNMDEFTSEYTLQEIEYHTKYAIRETSNAVDPTRMLQGGLVERNRRKH